MVRFCIADESPARRTALRDALLRYAQDAHLNNVAVVVFASVQELVASCMRMHARFYDLALCYVENRSSKSLAADADELPKNLQLVAQLRESHPQLPIVLVSPQAELAMRAYDLNTEFLMLPASREGLHNVLRETMSQIEQHHQACLALRSASGVSNVPLDDIQFVESSKRGPVVHLPAGQKLVARGTLKAFFDKLEPISLDPQADLLTSDVSGESPVAQHPFVMAGNSFIVNLDNVRASGKGALVFADGETIIVPTRKRRDLEAALNAYRSRT